MHRVKNFGGGVSDDARRSSASLDSQTTSRPFHHQQQQQQHQQQQHQKQQHAMDEQQLAMWLEKIRRRKAYRSPFSALMPARGNDVVSTVMIREQAEDEDDDMDDDDEVDDFDDDDIDEDIDGEDDTTYLDAASGTPSRVLTFLADDSTASASAASARSSSKRDPFKSPVSAVRDKRGGRVLKEGGILFDDYDV